MEAPEHPQKSGEKRLADPDNSHANKRIRQLSPAKLRDEQLETKQDIQTRMDLFAAEIKTLKARLALATPRTSNAALPISTDFNFLRDTHEEIGTAETPAVTDPEPKIKVAGSDGAGADTSSSVNAAEKAGKTDDSRRNEPFLFTAGHSWTNSAASSDDGSVSMADSIFTSQPRRRPYDRKARHYGPHSMLPPQYYGSRRESPFGSRDSRRGSSARHYDSYRGPTSSGYPQIPRGRTRALSTLLSGNSVTAFTRPSDYTRGRDELQPGTIISAPHHTQGRSDIVSAEDRNMMYSDFGAVHSKYRKMIILETWGEHCICLPLYTYRGKGLAGRRVFAAEYLSVRDDDLPYWDPKESSAEPLTAIRDKNWPIWSTFITGRTVVKLTEKIVHNYADKCSVEGHIARADFRRLYKTYMEMVKSKEWEILGPETGFKKEDQELEDGEIVEYH
ncbi:hypothetical protein BGZ61DRAFT_475062 [Ilyonectria robusta]|uniref:uncharacterized protein n=1 Tax=Ilyonectria robusta TaxID=1079257 RepID=UPI001E8CA10B|nr:uncharacterized protein BGZ61DRAFT_475062 [Ilyonectria robusta]KAH8729442.1 hypothetical protein BGZ61DRAFT_475062 [Ilyonectria robusta]